MPRGGKCLDPLGSEARGVFLPIRLPSDSIRVSFQCHWPILQMRQDEGRFTNVIVNNVSFRKPGFRIKNFAQSRAVDALTIDF